MRKGKKVEVKGVELPAVKPFRARVPSGRCPCRVFRT